MKVPPFEMPLEEIRASLEKLRRPLSIAVLRARNPFNVGAIIRVAHSFLVREIVLVGSERYYERGAMGMDRYENIVCVADEAALIARVRAGGGKLVVFVGVFMPVPLRPMVVGPPQQAADAPISASLEP